MMFGNNGFVEDGYLRAYSAVGPVVRAEVLAEYAERLEAAEPSAQSQIRLDMEREIERRIERRAPPDALY